MKHIIYYQFLSSLRSGSPMFWTFAFPLILGTLFYCSFGTSDKKSEWETIPVAVVVQEENETFATVLEEVEKGEDPMIAVQVLEEDAALEALDTGEVEGIYYIAQTPTLTIRKNSLESSILDGILTTYLRNETMIQDILAEQWTNPELSASIREIMEGITESESFTEEVSLGGEQMDSMLTYYFALIGMTCMYGCFLGLNSVMELQANNSSLGARRSVSPARKSIQIVSVFLVNFIIEFLCLMVVLLYLNYGLKIGFGNHWGGMILTCVFGSIIGVCMGIAIGSIGKLPVQAKIGINIGISMVMSFLSGLMLNEIKHVIEIHCPIVNRLNPVAVISDAFYCLCIYNDPVRYRNDLMILALFSIGLLLVSYLAIRRERYDSI